MSVLDRKLLRDIAATRSMLLAIVAIVAVGSGFLVGLQGVSMNLTSARDDYYRRCLMADFWVDLKKAPLTALADIADIPGVSRLRSRIVESVVVDMEGVERPVSGMLISMPETREDVVNGVIQTAGTWFTPGGRDEVIVSKDFAKARDVKTGDSIHLIMKGRRKKLRVVGEAVSSEYVYMTPPGSITPEPADFGVFYVTREFAENNLGYSGACNNIVGVLTPEAQAAPQTVFTEMEARLRPYGVFSTTPLALQSSNLALGSELGGLQSMATFMPVLFLSVAALILNVLMMRLAAQQRVVVGTLKAIGYGNGAVFAHFMKVGLIVGSAGALAGCVLGYFIAMGMTELYKTFFTFPALNNRFYPNPALLSFGASLAFGVLGTLRGVRHVAGLNPAEAMRPPPPKAGGKIILERFAALWPLFNFSWQTALRNIFRNRVRSLVGVFAAAMGTSILVSTFGMVDSLASMVTFQFDKVLLADYTLNFHNDRDYGAVFEAGRLPGVRRAEPLLYVPCAFQNENHRRKGRVTGLTRDAEMTIPRDGKGNPVPVPRSGLLMTRRMADHLRVEAGDSVVIVPTKGTRRPVEAKVEKVINSMFGMSVYADFEFLNFLVGEAEAVSAVRLDARQTPGEREAFFKQLKRLPSLLSLEDTSRQKAAMQATFVDKLGGMAYPMIVFGAVIFFGAILNASLISIIERRREIATYRVLGYQPGEIGRMFLRENMFLNLAGTLIGLPLGYWFLAAMAKEYTNDMYAMPVVVAGSSWFWSAALAVLFVLGSQVVVQRAVNKLDWRDALNMKE